jgi:hypothetical protein
VIKKISLNSTSTIPPNALKKIFKQAKTSIKKMHHKKSEPGSTKKTNRASPLSSMHHLMDI